MTLMANSLPLLFRLKRKEDSEMMRLENKIALVTGASRGIGRDIALAFAREGADITINCLASVELAEEVAREIKGLGRRAMVIRANVADKAEIEGMVKKIVAEFGRLDILVNNAGMAVVGASAELEESQWKKGIDVMLTGVFFCSQAAGKEMIKQQNGKIINIASIAGIGALPERACYCSAKAGVIQLTRVLGCEWAKYNINVNAVAPGYVKTALVEELIEKGKYDEEKLSARAPMGRLGTCEEVADAAVFLASEESRYITGQTIVVDGGWSSYLYLESWLQDSRGPSKD
jgi:NAD(P)-dependent dehydrogenase (short-subunit alcohol dehydrogenase family)